MSARNIVHSTLIATVLAFGSTCASLCHAACMPNDLARPAPRDPLAQVLTAQNACPRDAVEFVEVLKRTGARLEPTMVNFVGFNNPDSGAFFIFEIVSSDGPPSSALTIRRGDLLFGHFTAVRRPGNELVSLKRKGALLVEAIAWDPDKQFFNFYELTQGAWVYRGDSKSILDDVERLHRQRNASAREFKEVLRCSGCHINGGLLQKELAPPHNDWFVQDHQLPPGKLKPDSFVQGRLADMKDAGELTKLVVESAHRLADSEGYRKVLAARSMQEQLRPLFCPMELNIESDSAPFAKPEPTLHIPSAFFVDRRLATAEITIRRQDYLAARAELKSSLPGGSGPDADHGWLTPVKAQSDIVAIDSLIERGIVSKEFAVAVLAVDFTNPVFSATRCGLLKLVPDKGGADFVAGFQDALRGARVAGAAELLQNLSDPARIPAFHEKQALAYLSLCRQRMTEPGAVLDWFRLLAQRRVEVSDSEISKHQDGHVLEDEEGGSGRIVFPDTDPKAVPRRLALTPACQVQ